MESASKDTANATRKTRNAKRAYLILGVVAIGVAGAWLGHRWLTAGKQDTDDAQIEADVVPLAARVGGVILSSNVHDNQVVKKDEILFEIDPADLDNEVARTTSELAGAKAKLDAAKAQIPLVQSSSTGGLSSAKAAVVGASASVRSADDSVRAAEATVAGAKADLANADLELARAKSLFDKQAITRVELDRAQQVDLVMRSHLDAAQAQLAVAQAHRGEAQSKVLELQGKVTASAPVDQQVAAAQAAVAIAEAAVTSAQVALDKANLQRKYATVRAPVAGVISKLGAHAGQTVQPGQPLLMLVPLDTYVIANFKEGQIAKMKPGNVVDVELDAFPGTTLHGVVDTISPATGARFSMIPPDNATGNFVKVVQRVPVKITWSKAPDIAVRPGLSAEVVVHVD